MPRYPLAAAVAMGAGLAVAQPQPQGAAESRPLARGRFIAEMEAEFRRTDADKDGQLTRTEIEHYQSLQAVAQAEARNRAMFAQLDTDKNGQLSRAEFARLVATPPTPNAQPMLSRMDSNRDQQISLIEHRTTTLANFDRIDVDKDGVVTPAEMKTGGIDPR